MTAKLTKAKVGKKMIEDHPRQIRHMRLREAVEFMEGHDITEAAEI